MKHKTIPLNHHKKHYENVKFSVIIVSDTRYQQLSDGESPQDLTTPLIEEILANNNHILHNKSIIPDNKDEIHQVLSSFIEDKKTDIIIMSGGTGIGNRDVTIETVKPFFEKEITGFGELFRFLSYEEIGSAAMLSRATAGIVKSTIIFVLPGNPNAVKTALLNLILPEIDHMLNMLNYHCL